MLDLKPATPNVQHKTWNLRLRILNCKPIRQAGAEVV